MESGRGKEESKESEKKIPFSKKKKGSVCCCRNDGFGIGDWHDKFWWQTILVEVADLVLGNENTVKVNTEGEDRLETTK